MVLAEYLEIKEIEMANKVVRNKVRTICHILPEQKADLDFISERTGAPMAELIRRAIALYLTHDDHALRELKARARSKEGPKQ